MFKLGYVSKMWSYVMVLIWQQYLCKRGKPLLMCKEKGIICRVVKL